MKVNKDGTPRLEKGEVRVGNFFVKSEKGHVKIQDINSVCSVRVLDRLPLGIWLKNMKDLGEGGAESLKTYAATLFSLLSAAPDDGLVGDVLDAVKANVERHPEWYGGRAEKPTEADDARELDEQEGVAEFVEQVRGMADEG